ncbi:MAG TPA: tetratricopeptide repeat protein [Polyangia bacterium]|jgi:TolA-binding protein
MSANRLGIGLSALALLVLATGCGHAGAPAPAGPPRVGGGGAPSSQPGVVSIVMEPIQVVAHTRNGTREYEIFDAAGLFEAAGEALGQKRWDEAIAAYDRMLREFPDSRYVIPALYNAGLAHEAKRDWVHAVARFRAVADQAPVAKDQIDALFHLGACFSEAENWAASAEVFGRVLARADLPPVDRVEAIARRGFAQFKQRDFGASERTLREAIALYRKADTEQRLDNDFFLAMAHYYLAEIPHEQFRGQPIRLPEKQLERDLERKAQLLLTAQGRYIAAINVRNPHWAAASGYQVGALYREFYDAVVGAPIPHDDLRRRAKTAGVTYQEVLKAYNDGVRQYMRPVLENAIRIHEKTLAMAERVGVRNEWVDRATQDLDSLKLILAGKEPMPAPGAAPPRAPTPAPKAAPPPASQPRHKLKRDYYPRVTL